MLERIINYINKREPSFFWIAAIIFIIISSIMKLILPFIGNLYDSYPNIYVDTFGEFIFIIGDITKALALISLIYGVGLKFFKSFNEGQMPTFSEDSLFDDSSNIKAGDEIKLLKSYYNQVLRQSDISFTFSLVFATLGFIVIVFSIFLGNTEPTINSSDKATEASQIINLTNSKTWASVISGIVIEAVSALFFVQTNNARKTMIEFSDKIRLDRKITEALNLIEKIKCESIQSKVKALLVLNFSGLNMRYDDQDILKQIIESKFENLENISHQEEKSLS